MHVWHSGRAPDGARRASVSRRALLAGSAVAAGGLGGVAGVVATPPSRGAGTPGPAAVPFNAARQAGAVVPQQPYTTLLAYDLAPGPGVGPARAGLRALLADWTRVLEGVTAGAGGPDFRLSDTGPGRLTATVGIGPALAARLRLPVPACLADLPSFPADRLDPSRCGGDLLVQLCADDRWPLAVAVDHLHAAASAAGPPAVLRWQQTGFLPRDPGATPRNLLGFKDGTANPGPADADRWVWYPPGPFQDATVLVFRKIAVDLAAFAELPAAHQEAVIGRRRADGAPLTGAAEQDPPDVYAKHPDGSYVIPATAHVRLTSPRLDAGARMLRRGYSYDDAPDDRGLLFCAFMRDPALFVRVQSRLAERDALSRFLRHRASAVAYVLPGARPGKVLGEGLFSA